MLTIPSIICFSFFYHFISSYLRSLISFFHSQSSSPHSLFHHHFIRFYLRSRIFPSIHKVIRHTLFSVVISSVLFNYLVASFSPFTKLFTTLSLLSSFNQFYLRSRIFLSIHKIIHQSSPSGSYFCSLFTLHDMFFFFITVWV